MKKLFSVFLCLILLFSLSGCNVITWLLDEPMPTYEGYKTYEHGTFSQGQYTVMVYLNGSDLESEHGLATEDLIEMIEATYDRSQVRVIVQTGGTLRWHNDIVPADRMARFLVTADDIELLQEMPAVSMGEAQTLTDFIDFGMRYFPADRYGIVLWNHGGGSVSGFGVDELFDYDGLTLGELGAAFADSSAAGTRMEFIGFDACLMASVETAYAVHEYARYLVASEELEPGYGWDYKTWLSSLGADPSVDGHHVGRFIADSYVDFYNTYGMRDQMTMMSVTDLDRIDPVISALEGFVESASLSENSFNMVAKPRSQAHEFGMPSEYSGSIDMVDIVHLATQYLNLFPTESKMLMDAIDAAVLYRTQGDYVSNVHGLSMFFPFSNKESAARRVSLYQTSGFSVPYINFVTEFTNTMTGERLNFLELPEITQENDLYDLVLSPEELANMASIRFTAWIRLYNNTYIQIYEDSNVDIAEDGSILTQYDGTVTFIADNIACLYEIERGDGYVRYGVPATLNGEDVDLIVTFDDANPEGLVLGALPVGSEDHDMAAKQIIPIVDGDLVAMVYYAEDFAEEGDSPETEYNHYWFPNDEFTVEGPLSIEQFTATTETFLYGFTIVDLQGFEYYTDFIEIRY